MRIHCFQHVEFEGLGSIQNWADAHAHPVATTRLFAGDALPPLDALDWLIVMGGPMNVYEEREYPWLAGEKRFLRSAIEAGKTVLGICLGAQLLATVLGAKVTRNTHKEIGWFPIDWTSGARRTRVLAGLPERSDVFHWHGDTFELPAESARIASSEGCLNQGFLYRERVLALQFHLEVTAASAQGLIGHCGDELVNGKYIQGAEDLIRSPSRFSAVNALMDQILFNFASSR